MTPRLPLLLGRAGLVTVCWKGSEEKSTHKVADRQVKVLGICLLTVPDLENQKFFKKGRAKHTF